MYGHPSMTPIMTTLRSSKRKRQFFARQLSLFQNELRLAQQEAVGAAAAQRAASGADGLALVPPVCNTGGKYGGHKTGQQKDGFSMVAILFARSDSIYKTIPGLDVYDIERDARNYGGSNPVIAHPPCRAWGRLRALANPRPDEKELAFFALEQVRRFGGVLEHPKDSTLWPVAGLPPVGEFDKYGGWTLPVSQLWWGHRAQKMTNLYIVGVNPQDIPSIPLALGEAPAICGTSGRRTNGTRLHKGDIGWRPEISKAEREGTPPAFAAWLVDLASKVNK